MALVVGLVFASVILFLVLLLIRAARDLQSSPLFHRLCRQLSGDY